MGPIKENLRVYILLFLPHLPFFPNDYSLNVLCFVAAEVRSLCSSTNTYIAQFCD